MITKRLLVFSTIVCLFLPHIACADCADIGNFTSWVATGPHTVLFSWGNRPLALVNIFDCTIHPLSRIVLLKSYVCNSDTLMIDGKVCHIMNVTVLY